MTPKVLVRTAVCNHFDALSTNCAGRKETGGILIGRYRGPHLEVSEFTLAGPRDVRSQTYFIKQDEVHAQRARQVWRTSGKTDTNIGEWHTHPSGGVSPSLLDIRTWSELGHLVDRPMVFVLVAPGEWGLFFVGASALGQAPTRLSHRQRGTVGIVFGLPLR
ncbi:MAG: Mov34/MPN/PAD-1 family protein [Reyranella sp.]